MNKEIEEINIPFCGLCVLSGLIIFRNCAFLCNQTLFSIDLDVLKM